MKKELSSCVSVNKGSMRQSNIELLRIIAALSVIMIHIGDKVLSSLEWGSTNQVVFYMLESYAHCAVDVFILLTGYFSCMSDRRTIGKPVSLVFQVFLVGLAWCLAVIFVAGLKADLKSVLVLCTPNNYFVILFVALYIISPYLNNMIRSLNKKSQRKLLIISMIVFSVYPTFVDLYGEIIGEPWFGLSSIGAWGSQQGFNIVNFILLYIVGAFIKMNNITELVSAKKAMILLFVSWIVVFFWAEACHYLTKNGLISAWVYHNPFIIIMSASSLVLFSHIHITCKWINSLSGAAFMCYIIHTKLLGFLGLNYIVKMSCLKMFGCFLIIVIGLYLFSWIINIIYSIVFGKIMKKLDNFEVNY